jgi:putative DNA primase/helicase
MRHRIFLDRNTAQKIDRRMLGVAAAIKLDAHATISAKLTIGEGVETVLAARMMALGPVWSLASSGAVGRFPVLKGLTEITILQENDPTSRRDVETCGRRYMKAGKQVTVLTPAVGKDMNDSWRATR